MNDAPELTGEPLLDRYEVGEKVARGGMSVVYRARDRRLMRDVCVKIFHQVDGSERLHTVTREHFIQEAFALSQLTHPHTVRIYDFGYLEDAAEGGAPFYVCEFLDRGTLAARVEAQGPLPLHDVSSIVSSIALALDEAHSLGVIHRDVKPANIMFTSAGRDEVVKLTDFSIAKALGEEQVPHRATETNPQIGRRITMFSIRWAAPEQLRRRAVSAATDTFSLGLTALFMLLGRSVFPTSAPMPLMSLRAQGARWLGDQVREADLPGWLIELFDAVFRDDPKARLSLADFARCLRERTSAGVPDEGGEVTDVPIPETRSGRHPRTPAVTYRVPDLAQPVRIGARVARGVRVEGSRVLDPQTGLGARVRLARAADPSAVRELHVKGLNCFVEKDGRPSLAAHIAGDSEVRLVNARGKVLEALAIRFSERKGKAWVIPTANGEVAVDARLCEWVAAVDPGPDRDLLLLYQTRGIDP